MQLIVSSLTDAKIPTLPTLAITCVSTDIGVFELNKCNSVDKTHLKLFIRHGVNVLCKENDKNRQRDVLDTNHIVRQPRRQSQCYSSHKCALRYKRTSSDQRMSGVYQDLTITLQTIF